MGPEGGGAGGGKGRVGSGLDACVLGSFAVFLSAYFICFCKHDNS